jgi:alkanesulfonate monooxygenase SsuD/methylene tetrahydromethanopterin reductase-like flavin-dependent oxidoreductase (luciferase family)
LLLLAENGFPEGHPFRSVRAMPAEVVLPPIWLLGSSGFSAALAAACGMGFAFAHHFADYDAACVMLSYREFSSHRRRWRGPASFLAPRR